MFEMELYQFLLDNFGYDEPIFSKDLQEKLNIKDSTLRQKLNRLVRSDQLKRYERGIYYIPKPNSILKQKPLSINKVIKKKYLYDKDKPIGYRTGLAFANDLNLTTQTAGKMEIVTNRETNWKRNVKISNWNLILRKPRIEVTERNYKALQVLDLVANFDKISETPLDKNLDRIIKYIGNINLDKKELDNILKKYPWKTKAKVYESGLYNAFTRR